ncbi:MAG: pyruvate kinase alpha/beta domain-containing protein [Promethearchaeota archaeon]
MVDLKIEVTYFEKPGPENTDKTLNIAKKYADQFGLKDIIIASTTGNVAEKAVEIFNPNEYNLCIITHAYYFVGNKKRQEFPEEKIISLRNKGVKVFSGTHSMSGIERNIRMALKQWCFVDLMAKYLREQFSQGIKVCMEIASMAVDAGLINDLESDLICVGGTGHGADTVCLIKPAPTSEFNKLRVKAILAKPL